ncbi:MAG TPA: hypothetical protein VGO60_15545 [Iamia sp.]|jgi:hypothetical protein|nr:hypothetical protein [Iamia sp.]
MSPDPFRRLDRIDPPEQWDEITRRAAASGVDLDLGAVPDIRPRRRATALVAAAAAIALVAGIAIAGVGDAGDEEEHTATTTAPAPADEGTTCPFAVESLPGVALDESIVPPHDLALGQDATSREGTVDGRSLRVTVGVPGALASEGHSVGSATVDGEQTEAWTTYRAPLDAGQRPEGAADPRCTAAEVAIDATGFVGSGEGNDTFDGEALAPLQDRAEEILAAVRLSPPAEGGTTTSTVPAEQLALDGDCPFRLEPAVGTGPLRPIDRPPDANAQRSDRPATWGSVTVAGVEVLVGVGESDPQRNPTVGDRTGYEGGGGQAPGTDTLEGSGWVAEEGPCSFVSARAYLPAVARPEDTSSTVPEPVELPSSEVILVSQRLEWLVDVVLDAVVVQGPDQDDLVLDCVSRGPDALPTSGGTRCPQDPDPATLPPVTFPDDFGEAEPPEPPSPAARPGEVYFEAEAWDGFPIYVTRGERGVCVTAHAGSESCSGGADPKGLSMVEVPDPETGEPGGVVLLGARPAGTASTEVRSANGPVPGAEVTVAPDGQWFVAWVPIPFTELGMQPWPVVHRDAEGTEIPL